MSLLFTVESPTVTIHDFRVRDSMDTARFVRTIDREDTCGTNCRVRITEMWDKRDVPHVAGAYN